MKADAVGITSGEQGGAGRGTDGLSDMEVGVLHSVAGQAVEMRRGKSGGSESADVPVPLIICKNKHDIRRGPGGRSRLEAGQKKNGRGHGVNNMRWGHDDGSWFWQADFSDRLQWWGWAE